MAGISLNTGSGIDPKMVEQMVEAEKAPIRQIEVRKKAVQKEQQTFGELRGLVSQLGSSLNSLRTRVDFFKIKSETSAPEAIAVTADNTASVGQYTLEVKSLARAQKVLSQAFPDKDKTPIGAGTLSFHFPDGKTQELRLNPDRLTLQDVATQINSMDAGLRAFVVETNESLSRGGEGKDFRLMVSSQKTGDDGRVFLDPGLTSLQFHEQVSGDNLSVLFEDVPVFNKTNTLSQLVSGVSLEVRQALPGQKIRVQVEYDLDKTVENIRNFTNNYNRVNQFIENQLRIDPETGKAGLLAKDNNLRVLRQTLQGALQDRDSKNGSGRQLADIGLTTDEKTGGLKLDEAQVRRALAEDYEGVAKLFIQSDDSPGLGTRLSDAVRRLQNQENGIIPSKDREYKRLLDVFASDIAGRERLAEQRGEVIRRKFAAVEQLIGGMKEQSRALQSQLGSLG